MPPPLRKWGDLSVLEVPSFWLRRGKRGDHVECVRARAADEGEGGGADYSWADRHRAVAEGGAQGRPQLRPARPRGLLRPYHIPSRHQGLPRSGR